MMRFYLGHHKCASTWFEDVFGSVCYDLGLRYRILYTAKDYDHDLHGHLTARPADFVALANADYRHIEAVPNWRAVHVVRDPRDIVVSAYFSHLKTHETHGWPELIAYREKLRTSGLEDGLAMEIDFRREQFEQMMSFPLNLDNVLTMKMEDFFHRPYENLLIALDFLGLLDERKQDFRDRVAFVIDQVLRKISRSSGMSLPCTLKGLSPERALGTAWENRFEAKTSGRQRGIEDQGSHYRKGVAGDWRNHLSAAHLRILNDRHHDLFDRYGYDLG